MWASSLWRLTYTALLTVTDIPAGGVVNDPSPPELQKEDYQKKNEKMYGWASSQEPLSSL